MEQIDVNLVYAGRTLGMSDTKIFWKIIVPTAGPGIASGTILTFCKGAGRVWGKRPCWRKYPGQDRDHITEDRHGHPGRGLPDSRDMGGSSDGHRICGDLSYEPDLREEDEKHREVVRRVDQSSDQEKTGQLSYGYQFSE